MFIDINSSALVVHTNRLEKMSRSVLPYAIRSTLNSAAFDVKKNTMPESAKREFTQRMPNFFRANSSVEMAMGYNIDSMRATIGFLARGAKSDKAVAELEQQEHGGVIGGRSFIPMNEARGGNSNRGVRPQNRITGLKNVVNANTIEGKTPAQKFRHAAVKAGAGGYVLGNNAKQTLFKVLSVNDNRIKLRPLFSYQEHRSVRVKGTGFMESASLISASKMNGIYIAEAEKQIERVK